jgi:hypothetical protein
MSKYAKGFEYYNVGRDNGSDWVAEWVDYPYEEKEKVIFDELSKNSGEIQFSGKYSRPQKLRSTYAAGIKSLLSFYDKL